MDKFTQLTAIAAPLPMINVDTDKIIPARWLKTIKRTGLGPALFEAIRYKKDGSEDPDFILNKEPYRKAEILVTGENFGCGSSREHAAWALHGFGIKCVIAPEFADIFFSNAGQNGILLIKLPQTVVDVLMKDAEMGHNARLTVDLESQTITRPNGETVKFDVDPFRKHCLLNGLDNVGLTMQKGKEIEAYEANQAANTPWLARA
ncbi:MAG: 3-isopropylmalate dehydratase small subunit [Alphaproteobacteria bacterium]